MVLKCETSYPTLDINKIRFETLTFEIIKINGTKQTETILMMTSIFDNYEYVKIQLSIGLPT